ncbi:MAG: hypothetical protein K2M17_02385, partial [Bacilli bacterium]|nr:hypothetical protein [Bacilli bacterium]
MLKVKSITTYPKKIGRSLKKKALLVVVASIAAVTLIACGSDTSQSEDYGTNVTALEMEIDRLNRVIGQKDKEIGDLHCTEEKLNRRIDILGKENDSLKEKNASSNETIDSLTKKNEELQAKIEGEVQTSPVTNSIPKDYAKRIFYNEDGYLDVDSVGDAFQFTGVEDYQMEYHNPWENGYIVAVNPHKMGDYFVELAKDGVGYLVSATDYTDVKISGVEFGKVDDLYTLVYCPYYDSKNGGKDSPEGYSGYILNIKNKDNVKDQRQTIYDFDTFEVLARDVILEDTSLFSYHWACDYKHIY